MQKETDHPFTKLSQPAQRALANAGVHTLEQLSALSEKENIEMARHGQSIITCIDGTTCKAGISF